MRDVFKQVGGLLLPDSYPEQVGLGCPKCDDHELVPMASASSGEQPEAIRRFVKRHATCGLLDQIEVRGGQLGVTGVVDLRPVS